MDVHYTDEMLSVYPTARTLPREVVSHIIDSLHVGRKSRILDVGTGPGSLALELADTSSEVLGIDVSPTCVRLARKRARQLQRKVRFACMDANDLQSLKDSSFEVVTASQVIHWLQWDKALASFHRVLAAQGVLVLVESKLLVHPASPLFKSFGLGSISHTQATQKCEDQLLLQRAKLHETEKTRARKFTHGSAWIYRQKRLLDEQYAKAYLFPQRVHQMLGGEESSGVKLQRAFAGLPKSVLHGTIYWLVSTFEATAQ